MPVTRIRPLSRHIVALDMHGIFQVAAFLVRHARGLALVDAGFPGWHFAILAAVETLPPPNRISHVILTHAHADHVGSAVELARVAGSEMVASAIEQPFIEGRSLASAARKMLPRTVLRLNHWLVQRKAERPRVTRAVKEGDVVCGLKVIEVPGHTPGQIALLHEEDRIVLCADTLFNVRGHLGHDPIPGITLDSLEAEASMARIADLGVADVAPSHGPALLGDAPDRIHRFLDSSKR